MSQFELVKRQKTSRCIMMNLPSGDRSMSSRWIMDRKQKEGCGLSVKNWQLVRHVHIILFNSQENSHTGFQQLWDYEIYEI